MATENDKIILNQVDKKLIDNVLNDIINELVNHSWCDSGTLFFEIGNLDHEKGTNNPIGDYSFMIDIPWRFEDNNNIVFSSEIKGKERDEFIKTIIGSKVVKIDFLGCSKDLSIKFSNYNFKQFSLDLDMHSWSLRVNNIKKKYLEGNLKDFWLSFEDGDFYVEYEKPI